VQASDGATDRKPEPNAADVTLLVSALELLERKLTLDCGLQPKSGKERLLTDLTRFAADGPSIL
jgi:hypothetical protein